MFVDLLLLTVIVCFIVDVSGALRNFKKPLSCSLCMTWWSGLFYLAITHNFNLQGIAIVAVLSMMTPVVTGSLLTFREILNWILTKIIPR